MAILHWRKGLIILALATLALAASSPAQAAYTITDLGENVAPRGINNSGQVAAQLNSSGVYSPLFYSNGLMQALGMFGGGSTSVTGINNAGQIIAVNNVTYEGYIYNSATGVLTDMGNLGGGGHPTGINDAGQVVGSISASYGWHSFLYQNGTLTDIGTAGAQYINGWTYINNTGLIAGTSTNGVYVSHSDGSGVTYIASSGSAAAITDSGQVIGSTFFTDPQNAHAFSYSGGVLTDLGTFEGGMMSVATAINNKGQIVGYSYDSEYNPYPFLYDNGQTVDAVSQITDGAGWNILRFYGINDDGQIIGTATLNGVNHGFLLTPEAVATPLPPAFLMFGGGLAGLGLAGRRFFRV